MDRHAPESWKPYLKLTRIDRPIGTLLVLYPGLWGLALAAPHGAFPDPALAAIFTTGAFLMRSAGCTVNDIWDRDFDGKVARTAQRPLASGRLSLPAAVAFLGAQLSLGLALLLQLNAATIELGVLSVGIVVAYPLMKRFTHWPQLVLGTAMNYGALMGWTAVHPGGLLGKEGKDSSVQGPTPVPQLTEEGAGLLQAAASEGTEKAAAALTSMSNNSHSLLALLDTLPPGLAAAAPLYAGGIAWTMVYDTIYAHQDKADDARLGLKSTALRMGDNTKAHLTAWSLAAGALWAVTGLTADLNAAYFAAVLGSTGHMLWQVHSADYNDRLSLTQRFVSNKWVGLAMLLGLVAGNQ